MTRAKMNPRVRACARGFFTSGAVTLESYRFSWLGWLKAQAALVPLLLLVGGAAVTMADARYDDRYLKEGDGKEIRSAVNEIQRAAVDLKTQQAVNGQKIEGLTESIEDLKKGQDAIGAKLDRLIERSH